MSKECKKCRNSVAEVPRRGRCYCPDPDDNSKCALFKPMTNADRIRVMTDEELEEGIRRISIGWEPWCDHHCKMNGDDNCNECLRKYIQQPVKEDAE